MASVANLAVNITGHSRDLIREFHKVGNAADDAAKRGHSGWKKAGKGIGVASLGIAGAILGIGIASADAAVEDQRSQALLRSSLKSTVGANKEQVASVEKWITAQQNASGTIDDELRPALSQLLRSTGSVTKSQGLLKTAMNVSTATGKPLQAVSIALGKAYNGNVAGLARLGIQTKDASGKTLSFHDILDQLNKKMGGATAAAADTAAGKMKIMRAKFEDAKEQIGAALIPILAALADFLVTKVIPAIEATVKWVQKNWPAVKEVIVNTVHVIQNIVRTVLDAIHVFWRNWGSKIVAFTTAMFNGIKSFIQGALNVIRGIIQIVTGLIHGDWSRVWTGIKNVFKGVWDLIKGIVQGAIAYVKLQIQVTMAAIHGIWTAAWGGIKRAFQNVWDGIVGIAKGAVAAVMGVIQPMIDAIKWVVDHLSGLVGGSGHGTPPKGYYVDKNGVMRQKGFEAQYPPRAAGGPVSPFKTYVVGEKRPELLTMGSRGGYVHPQVPQPQMAMAGRASNVTIETHIHVAGNVLSNERQLATTVENALVRHFRTNGKRWLNAVTPV